MSELGQNRKSSLRGYVFRFALAGSTGRRNTGVKSLCWGFKLQGLTWPFVELTSHFVQIGLRIQRQVGALWGVLSQEAIGVLVRPALPWALRIAKIYVDFGRQTVDRELGGVVQRGERPMARELEGKVAVVTGAASGIGLASPEAMLAGGSRVVMVDRDEAALKALCNRHGDAVIPLVIDLLDPKDCAMLVPRALEKAGQLTTLHANGATYVGGPNGRSTALSRRCDARCSSTAFAWALSRLARSSAHCSRTGRRRS